MREGEADLALCLASRILVESAVNAEASPGPAAREAGGIRLGPLERRSFALHRPCARQVGEDARPIGIASSSFPEQLGRSGETWSLWRLKTRTLSSASVASLTEKEPTADSNQPSAKMRP